MDDFYRMKKLVDTAKENDKIKYQQDSKKRLEKIIETKNKTSFIGAISAFEELFGFLWGCKNNEITPEQQEILNVLNEAGFTEIYFKELWEQARTQVLNNGNTQARALKNELSQYTINWERYQTILKVENIKKEDCNEK